MEQFTLLEGDHTLKESRQLINNALLTVRSLSADTAFPTDNLTDGMLCYRTDLGRLYSLADAASGTWTNKLPADLGGTADAVSWAGILDKPAAFPAADHAHPYAGAAASGGSALSADKLAAPRTINGVAFDGTADITIVSTIAQGGTGATTAANARDNLGLAAALTDASVNGQELTFTRADGTKQTLTTQDTKAGTWSIDKNSIGYAKDSTTGLLLQWGSITTTYKGVQTVTFPTPFTAVPTVMVSTNIRSTAGNKIDSLTISSITASNCTIDEYYESGTASPRTVYWFAIGY